MARGSAGKNSIGLGTRLPLAVRAAGPSLSLGSTTSAEAPETRTAWAQAVQCAERTSQSSMFSPRVLPVTVWQDRFRAPMRFEFAENGVDAAGAVDVLDVVIRGRRHLAEAGDAPRDGVDAGDVVRDAGLAGDGEGVEDGVGGAAHGDVEHRARCRRPRRWRCRAA